MYYIQSGDEDTLGLYLMGFVGAMPVWTEQTKEAKRYDSQDDTASDERNLEKHSHLCWVISS